MELPDAAQRPSIAQDPKASSVPTQETDRMEENTPDRAPEVDSKFRFVLVAASRAEQLIRGARPKVEAGKRKPTRLAMEEVAASLVDWGYGPPPAPEPAPEPEIEEQPAGEVH